MTSQINTKTIAAVSAFALTAGICLAGALPVGTEYFASPDGVDHPEMDCLTESTAGSLMKALSCATQEGDVVTLLSGTYDFTRFTPSATAKIGNASTVSYYVGAVPVVIRSQSGKPEDVTLQGGGSAIDGRCFFFKSPIVVCGVTITNFYTSSSAAAVYSTDRQAMITNCIVNCNEAAANCGAVYQVKAVECSFSGNHSKKVSGVGSTSDFINCNVISNSFAAGSNWQKGGLIRNSTASGCKFGFVSLPGNATYGVMISESTLTNCTFANIQMRSGCYGFCNECELDDCDFRDCYIPSTDAIVYKSTLRRCTFERNYGRGTTGCCVNSSDCYDCTFSDNVLTNTAGYGGGGAGIYGSYYNCRFNRNVSLGYGNCRGGALVTPTYVTNCVFVGNYSADSAGAIGVGNNVSADASLVVDSFFTNNVAVKYGGTVYGVTVSNCVINGSLLTGGLNGGGGYNCRVRNSLVECCTMTNKTNGTGYGGAGLAGGSAVNCTIRLNCDVYYGTAAACYNVAMTNCLVYGNVATGWGPGGGGAIISASASQPAVNCTIVSNTPISTYAACRGSFVNCIMADNDIDVKGDTTLDHCIYVSKQSGTGSEIACIQVDSSSKIRFKTLDFNDKMACFLKRNSPAVNKGANLNYNSQDLDLAGNPRLFGEAVDIGCYEYIPGIGFLVFLQ